MKKINLELIDKLCLEAKNLPRRRKNHNFHEDLADPFQRLLNAVEPGTYFQPHKHENPDKREMFILLRGKALVITFNNKGDIADYMFLDPQKGSYGAEIPARVWHTIIILESNTVIFESKDGPYEPLSDKNFASWAPAEGDEYCQAYNARLLELCGAG
ncbi:MAG: WbuC family cupin fold metalloprotein [Bacteroidales bacterium]|nr:WbuC family cupin fold metalloprotein [Bacteroidales bacterium]